MTEPLYNDAYLKSADGRVECVTPDGGVVLDRALFYPTGGGQPGDSGRIAWPGGEMDVETTVKGSDGAIVLVPPAGADLPPAGTTVSQTLDWETRYCHMRFHTALHLLSCVIPLPVTGGQVSAAKGRLDFDMPEPPADKQALEDALNKLVARGLDVTTEWITDEELADRPEMVKTMSVKPPVGAGRVRLVRIGDAGGLVDLQPCGGTHVANTSEIGALRLGKIEKKSRLNRRVNVLFA